MTEDKTPRDYGLNHDVFRPYQREIIEKLLNKSSGSITLLSAPVGSGKTSLAKAMGISEGGVTALVKTRLLQSENYLTGYNFDILFGKANYDCPHSEQPIPDATAAECLFEGEMSDCDQGAECPFLNQKAKVIASKTRCLNYALFMMSRWTRIKKYATEYLFVDEAHMLADETVEFCGLTIRDVDRLRYGLPEFPACYQSNKDSTDKTMAWIEDSIDILSLKASVEKEKFKKSKIERLSAKLEITLSSLGSNSSDWYCRSGGRALEYNGQPKPGLIIKPLTARYNFPKLFLGNYDKTVLMSATIGDPVIFAEELGIKHYEYDAIPNNFSAERRPVLVPDCPTMGYKSSDADKMTQARIITKHINDCPVEWEGVIHCTSWSQSREIKERLIKAGLNRDRLFVPDQGGGTNGQMDQWVQAKKRGKGMLIITPSMSEGVSLEDERICVIAKVPFPSIAPGSYDQERMVYSNKLYSLRTAQGLEQRAGRTRRGKEGDYDTSYEKRGLVMITDGAFRRKGIAKFCSKDFVDSLVY